LMMFSSWSNSKISSEITPPLTIYNKINNMNAYLDYVVQLLLE
jgi:hypothetical protein